MPLKGAGSAAWMRCCRGSGRPAFSQGSEQVPLELRPGDVRGLTPECVSGIDWSHSRNQCVPPCHLPGRGHQACQAQLCSYSLWELSADEVWPCPARGAGSGRAQPHPEPCLPVASNIAAVSRTPAPPLGKVPCTLLLSWASTPLQGSLPQGLRLLQAGVQRDTSILDRGPRPLDCSGAVRMHHSPACLIPEGQMALFWGGGGVKEHGPCACPLPLGPFSSLITSMAWHPPRGGSRPRHWVSEREAGFPALCAAVGSCIGLLPRALPL